jgi:phosphoribosylamine--glycine ligase
MLPVSQDHKRAFDGDRGPNTGGMGAYSPAPMFTDALRGQTEREIIRPALQGLRAEGIDFRGLLYAGLMLTPRGPRVVEFNARFGDPETQAVLPRLRVDWGELLFEAARGELDEEPLPEPERAASVCVVAATRDYPESSESGLAIRGVAEAEATGALVFHAGTETGDGGLVTAGGRVLGVTATADSLREAVSGAYAALDHIDFDGMRFRRDIAYRVL